MGGGTVDGIVFQRQEADRTSRQGKAKLFLPFFLRRFFLSPEDDGILGFSWNVYGIKAKSQENEVEGNGRSEAATRLP